MNVNFLNPFVEAAFEVMRVETGQSVQRGDLKLEKSVYHTDDVTVIIALVGEVQGTVCYSMNNATALALAGRIMGEALTELDALAQSGIAELGNVITGRASVRLSEAGYEATISPPALLLGQGATLSTLDFPRLVVPMMLDAGIVLIHLALRDGPRSGKRAADLPVPQAPAV